MHGISIQIRNYGTRTLPVPGLNSYCFCCLGGERCLACCLACVVVVCLPCTCFFKHFSAIHLVVIVCAGDVPLLFTHPLKFRNDSGWLLVIKISKKISPRSSKIKHFNRNRSILLRIIIITFSILLNAIKKTKKKKAQKCKTPSETRLPNKTTDCICWLIKGTLLFKIEPSHF